jgi:hypothetical protein
MGVFLLLIKLHQLFNILLGFWALCLYCQSTCNNFLIGLLGIVFLLFIKLHQVSKRVGLKCWGVFVGICSCKQLVL